MNISTIVYYDNYNNIMIVCTHCHSSTAIKSFTEKCPLCQSNVIGKINVSCAHIDHNEEKGCGNKDCWKYKKEIKND